ncbi:MAG TPA: hypothetical protein VH575_25960 [Gemmataceae bacterium]|jgi:hypothetical protein
MNVTEQTTLDNGSTRDSSPTQSERLARVHAYQQQAMARPDPLAANLGTIAGDLMRIAHALTSLVQPQLLQGAVSEATRRRFVANLEFYLKVVRQSDRLAQIERQLGAVSADRSQVPSTPSGMVAGALAAPTPLACVDRPGDSGCGASLGGEKAPG